MRTYAFAAAALLLLAGCLGTPKKTEAYLFPNADAIRVPVDAWLRTVEIVSNNIPLSADYALATDTLVAVAYKNGIRLSAVKAEQPYVMDLTIHERSYTVDLSTMNSVMAVLNVSPSAEGSPCTARVVYSAVSSESVVALYYVSDIGQSLFSTLRQSLEARPAASK